jgi:hypothetical protein
MMTATGASKFFFTDYEHVSIGELQVNGIGKGVTVTFKDPAFRLFTITLHACMLLFAL